MTEQDGLICAFVLDGQGGGHQLDWAGVRAWTAEQGPIWIHLDRSSDDVRQWLTEESGLDDVVKDALLAEDIRPRVLKMADALLINLRGVNLNPGADPEDMVGARIWTERDRIVTVRQRRIMAINDIREDLAKRAGPADSADLLVTLCERLIERMGPVIAEIDDNVDELENEVLVAQSADLRSRLADVRQATIQLRRYLAPQRDAMARLHTEHTSWLNDSHRSHLREIADRTLRYVEDLDAARERAAVTQDELNNRLSEQMNKTMYVLTVVAAVLLPPSLMTGLLGINVGGMPGVENPWAFAVVAALIVVIAVIEVLVLRHLKWI